MIDLRLWRISLLAVPVVVLIAMFSLQEVPPPLQPALPPDAFDSSTATSLAKQLAQSDPDPRPGSKADIDLGALVKARLSAIQGASLAEQQFTTSYAGHDVHLRNLIGTIPGESDRQVALIAPRDVADGTGALTSNASTALLLEIASSFSGSTHKKTLVFVSTDGSSLGALGARRFVRDYTNAGLLDAAIDLSQPAVRDPKAPLVVPWSTGPQNTASQLADTANSTVSKEMAMPAGDEGPISDLFRLALPAALGEQGPLVQAGLPAVRLSSHGELPIEPSQDKLDNFDQETFGNLGRAALSLMLALDATPGPVEHGPTGYIGVVDNLLPGWTIGLLALSLLVPVAIGAGSGLAAGSRSPNEAARGIVWTLVRAIPFIGALVVISFAALVGLMPSPPFPFDPGAEHLGTGGTISVVVAAVFYCVCAFFLRPLRAPPADAVATATPAALLLAVVAALGVWAENPYLGLIVALGLQAWLLAAARLFPGRLIATGLVLVGLIPLAALVGDLGSRFGVGFGVWHDLLFMYTDGQLSALLALLGCVLAGAGVAIVAVAGPGPAPPAPEMRVRTRREEAEPAGGEISVRRKVKPPATPDTAAGEAEDVAADERPGSEAGEDEPAPDTPAGASQAEPGDVSGEREEVGEDAEPAPAQPEPERDPRLWSKPRGSSSWPFGRRRTTPPPSLA
jgi:peptidase M28-like protein